MKTLKIIGIVIGTLAVYILVTIGYSLYSGKFYKDDPNAYYVVSTSGNSMEQYGIEGGTMEYRLFYNLPCQIGDNCQLTCLADKCRNGEAKMFVKKLIKVEGDCFWFEGNPRPYMVDGVRYVSWDSRKYGWLCGNELEIGGVVK